MKYKVIKIGFVFTVCFSLAGIFNPGTVKAETLEYAAKSSYSRAGKGCQVTTRTAIYVNSLDADYVLGRGTRLIVVNPEPHQGIITVKTIIKKKLRKGEIKLDDTNCVPILPQ